MVIFGLNRSIETFCIMYRFTCNYMGCLFRINWTRNDNKLKMFALSGIWHFVSLLFNDQTCEISLHCSVYYNSIILDQSICLLEIIVFILPAWLSRLFDLSRFLLDVVWSVTPRRKVYTHYKLNILYVIAWFCFHILCVIPDCCFPK